MKSHISRHALALAFHPKAAAGRHRLSPINWLILQPAAPRSVNGTFGPHNAYLMSRFSTI